MQKYLLNKRQQNLPVKSRAKHTHQIMSNNTFFPLGHMKTSKYDKQRKITNEVCLKNDMHADMQTSHDGIGKDHNHHEGTNVVMEGRKQGRGKFTHH